MTDPEPGRPLRKSITRDSHAAVPPFISLFNDGSDTASSIEEGRDRDTRIRYHAKGEYTP